MEQCCPECGSSNVILDYGKGKTVCQACGMVVDDAFIMDESEWRNFSNDKAESQSRNRVGGPMSEFDQEAGLSTTFDATGDMGHLGRYQRSGSSAKQVALQEAFSEISRIAGLIGLGSSQSIISAIKAMYKEMNDSREMKGRDRMTLITTAFYYVCKQAKVSRSLKELCQASGSDIRKVKKSVLKVGRVEVLKQWSKTTADSEAAHHGKEYMIRFCTKLGLPQNISHVAMEASERAAKLGVLDGRTPAVIAAACLFLVCSTNSEWKRSEEEVASVAQVSPSTVKRACSLLVPFKDQILNDIVESQEEKTLDVTTSIPLSLNA
jgi:transcription initiation factor TFIIB